MARLGCRGIAAGCARMRFAAGYWMFAWRDHDRWARLSRSDGAGGRVRMRPGIRRRMYARDRKCRPNPGTRRLGVDHRPRRR
jgi:hypothetical protein